MILLRKGKEEDLASIINLAEKIWPTTYQAYLSEEQISYMLNLMYNRAELLSQLQSGHTFLIASLADADVGFASFSKIDPEQKTFKLHKIYVLPTVHGKGVGKILMNEVVNLVKRNGGLSLQLNVNRNNNAQQFYEKAGFKIIKTVDLEIGNGFYMNDYVMEKIISS